MKKIFILNFIIPFFIIGCNSSGVKTNKTETQVEKKNSTC
jgi:hypothetical protein